MVTVTPSAGGGDPARTLALLWRDPAAVPRHGPQAHPWAADISTIRPPLGPGLMAKYEHELAALESLGLDDIAMDAALTHLLTFVQAWARSAAGAQATRGDSAAGDEEWWAAHAPLLRKVLDPAAYPLAARVGTTAGTAHGAAYNPQHAYDFGLRTILDGLAALIGGAGRQPRGQA